MPKRQSWILVPNNIYM